MSAFITKADQWDYDRWPNFTPEEMECRGTGKLRVRKDALDALQALRTCIGKPFYINSAYRSPEHNAAVGGAKNSQHLHGRAFDIALRGFTGPTIERMAREHGFRGIGRYNTFIHIDTRERGATWGQW